jgi:5'-methylthioadenosine phosphorylase
MSNIGIIGGTGVYSPDLFTAAENVMVNTVYGAVELIKTSFMGNNVFFLERHGKGHGKAPHSINYLANISALKALNIEFVFATAAVGSLDKEISPGSFVIIDQFLDFTKNRASTFFQENEAVVHIDMTEPYCPQLRKQLIEQSRRLNIKTFDSGTYVCTQGPRFENKAEINMYKMLGAQVVGMTNCPEVFLAREANLCYATVAMVTNYSTGISETPLTHKEVMDNMQLMSQSIKSLLLKVIETLNTERTCECKNSTIEQGNLK